MSFTLAIWTCALFFISAEADCTVPQILVGAASWDGTNCKSGATDVADGTTCTITETTGYFCVSPGLCTGDTFAGTAGCEAATKLTGSLTLQVPDGFQDNSTMQNDVKQGLASVIQVPVEFITLSVPSTRLLSERQLSNDITVPYTVAIPADGTQGSAEDAMIRFNSLTSAALQGAIQAFNTGISVASMTQLTELGKPAVTKTTTPGATGTTTPATTVTSTPAGVAVKLFHREDEEVMEQSNAWVYPVFGLVTFLSLASFATIYVRRGRRNMDLPLPVSASRSRELTRADDGRDEEGLLRPLEME